MLRHGRSREEDFDGVVLHVRGDRWGVQLDVTIFPLYCTSCGQQLPHLYYAGGSRYGHVGNTQCDRCGAAIAVIDSDNIVEYHEVVTAQGQLRIDYRKLYRLDNESWAAIKLKTGYDIIAWHKDQEIPLSQAVTEICTVANVDPSLLDHQGHSITDERFARLPVLVNRWLGLLHHLKIVGA